MNSPCRVGSAHRVLLSGFRSTVAVFLAVLVGCEKPAPLPSLPPAALPEVKRATATEAAVSALRLLQAELRAAAGHVSVRPYRDAMLKLLTQVEMERELTASPVFKPVLGENLLDGLIENWAATFAFYAEGFDFAAAAESPAGDKENVAYVRVPARVSAGDAVIRVECRRGSTGEWSVFTMGFEAPRGTLPNKPAATASAPASQPATRTP